jgi:hypothetical protein
MLNPQYHRDFTEQLASGIKHPGNAWSSLVYAWLGCDLLLRGSSLRPLTCWMEGLSLLWFSSLSFGYHATEIEVLGALDVTMVLHLCMSCLWQLCSLGDFEYLQPAWSITLPLLADVFQRQDASRSIAVRFMMPLLTTVVLALLAVMAYQQIWLRSAMFAAAFVLKLLDLAAARGGVRMGALNGTSVFHLLTGGAMYLHYAAVF